MPPDIRLVDGSSPPPASAPGRARDRIPAPAPVAPGRREADRAGLGGCARRCGGATYRGRADGRARRPGACPGTSPRSDAHLPWGGLATGGLHDVVAADAGMASAFCALICARLADAGGSGATVLWCEGARALDAGMLHGPGLRRFGLDPERLTLACTGRDAEILWAMEEGLRCASLAAVVGAVRGASLSQTRRLQFAAESHGVSALMLRPPAAGAAPSAAMTRWRIDPVPGKAAPGEDFTAGLADGAVPLPRRAARDLGRGMA